jgi:hypothetical protein
LLHHLNV